jgi:hypothetical protein
MSQTWFRIVKNGKFASRTYKICKTLVKFVSPKKIIHTSLKSQVLNFGVSANRTRVTGVGSFETAARPGG